MKSLEILKSRFLAHPERHPHISWDDVEGELVANPDKFAVIERMEETGGEPDVVEIGEQSGKILFLDCSEESPK